MGIGELLIIILGVGIIGLAIAAKQWFLAATFFVFFCIFGGLEWLSIKMTGKSISQNFQKYSTTNKIMAWIILIVMGIFWLVLLIHLGIKLL